MWGLLSAWRPLGEHPSLLFPSYGAPRPPTSLPTAAQGRPHSHSIAQRGSRVLLDQDQFLGQGGGILAGVLGQRPQYTENPGTQFPYSAGELGEW